MEGKAPIVVTEIKERKRKKKKKRGGTTRIINMKSKSTEIITEIKKKRVETQIKT